jgi:hypothetical protein
MTRDELVKGMLSFCQAWEREMPPDQTIDLYHAMLDDIPSRYWPATVKQTIQTENHWPRVAAIRNNAPWKTINADLQQAKIAADVKAAAEFVGDDPDRLPPEEARALLREAQRRLGIGMSMPSAAEPENEFDIAIRKREMKDRLQQHLADQEVNQ